TGSLNVANSTFSHNTGTVVTALGPVSVSESSFVSNERGLVIRAGMVENSQFEANVATAIGIEPAAAKATMRRQSFNQNVGGGAVRMSSASAAPGTMILIRDDTFTGNSNSAGGGAIDVTAASGSGGTAAQLQFVADEFDNNIGTDGGAVRAQ